jgi:hypothetical protein
MAAKRCVLSIAFAFLFLLPPLWGSQGQDQAKGIRADDRNYPPTRTVILTDLATQKQPVR